MNKLNKLFLTAFLLAMPFVSHAAASADPQAEVVKQKIAAFMEKNNIPGVAVELYINGMPHAYYFGYANRDKKTPITKKTIFEIGSISKVMTSVLLAQEVDFAKMSFSDPITKYLPDLSAAFNNVPLQSLATYTSGLPFSAPAALKTQADLTNYLKTLAPSYTPNKQWVYSNFGIGLLGYALEKVTHKDLNQLYQKRILAPLGMQPLGSVVPAKLKSYVAQGYDRDGNPVAPMKVNLFPAAGSFKMSADDMQRFLKAAIGLPGTPDRLFYPIKMTQAVFVKLPDKMQGLGWQVQSFTAEDAGDLLHETQNLLVAQKVEDVLKIPMYNGDALIDKSGATDGFRTYIAVIPNKKSGIAILTNKSVLDNQIVNLGREILFSLTK